MRLFLGSLDANRDFTACLVSNICVMQVTGVENTDKWVIITLH